MIHLMGLRPYDPSDFDLVISADYIWGHIEFGPIDS